MTGLNTRYYAGYKKTATGMLLNKRFIGLVLSTPEEFENGGYFSVRLDLPSTLSRHENVAFGKSSSRRLCVLVWTENILKTKFSTIMSYTARLKLAFPKSIAPMSLVLYLSFVAKIDFNPRISRTSLHRNLTLGKQRMVAQILTRSCFEATNILLLFICT